MPGRPLHSDKSKMDDLTLLLQEVDGVESKYFHKEKQHELLRLLRKSKIRRPDLVARFCPSILKGGRITGGEQWNLYEQLFLASLDMGDSKTANECLSKLQGKFPNSGRVNRLVGMQLEYNGKFEDALTIYKKLLEENPSNLLVMKRKVCVYRAQGQIKKALDELNEIVKLYTSDAASWLELGELHIRLGDYASAAFCFEELVLIDANCSHYHTRLAEAYYSIGGLEGYLKSRKHYTLSLALTSARINIRAMYGLMCACKAFAEAYKEQSESPTSAVVSSNSTSSSSSGKTIMTKEDIDVNTALLKWGKDSLEEIWKDGKGSRIGDVILKSAILS